MDFIDYTGQELPDGEYEVEYSFVLGGSPRPAVIKDGKWINVYPERPIVRYRKTPINYLNDLFREEKIREFRPISYYDKKSGNVFVFLNDRSCIQKSVNFNSDFLFYKAGGTDKGELNGGSFFIGKECESFRWKSAGEFITEFIYAYSNNLGLEEIALLFRLKEKVEKLNLEIKQI